MTQKAEKIADKLVQELRDNSTHETVKIVLTVNTYGIHTEVFEISDAQKEHKRDFRNLRGQIIDKQ